MVPYYMENYNKKATERIGFNRAHIYGNQASVTTMSKPNIKNILNHLVYKNVDLSEIKELLEDLEIKIEEIDSMSDVGDDNSEIFLELINASLDKIIKKARGFMSKDEELFECVYAIKSDILSNIKNKQILEATVCTELIAESINRLEKFDKINYDIIDKIYKIFIQFIDFISNYRNHSCLEFMRKGKSDIDSYLFNLLNHNLFCFAKVKYNITEKTLDYITDDDIQFVIKDFILRLNEITSLIKESPSLINNIHIGNNKKEMDKSVQGILFFDENENRLTQLVLDSNKEKRETATAVTIDINKVESIENIQ